MKYETLEQLHEKRLANHPVKKHRLQPIFPGASMCSLCFSEKYLYKEDEVTINRTVECCQDCLRTMRRKGGCNCGTLNYEPLIFEF
jgi:hypothetical protein